MDENNGEDFEKLQFQQRLKAALHHSTLKLCQQQSAEQGIVCSKQLVASISETAWRQCQTFAEDMELFAKHAKRSTVNADDVKMLTRRSAKLHQYISNIHEKITEGKQETKKRKPAKKKSASATTSTVTMETDDDSNMA